MNKLFSNKEWNVPRPFGQALRVTRKGYRKMCHPRWGSLSQKIRFFRCHRNRKMNKLFSNKEWIVPRQSGGSLRGIQKGYRKIFHTRCWLPFQRSEERRV